MFLRMATTCGADPFRIRLASSRSAPSHIPCMPFSMPQWPETQARNARPRMKKLLKLRQVPESSRPFDRRSRTKPVT